MEQKKCKQCGKPITQKRHRERAKFCNKDCYGLWLKKNKRGRAHHHWVSLPPLYCSWCKKELRRRSRSGVKANNFCNHRCYGNWLSKNKRGENHPNYGKTQPPQTIKAVIAANRRKVGAKHYNWKGGISCEPYCSVWLDKEFKDSIKERDGYRCLNPACSRGSKRLAVHHINYDKKDCHPMNLITLCYSCNGGANYNREWYQVWYRAIIMRRYAECLPT